MKKVVFFLAIAIFTAMTTFANDGETFNVQIGEQKTTRTGKIVVKFIEVMDDSRCPPNVNCVWAGNARVKISVKRGKKAAKTLELNSNLQPNLITYEGYDIKFGDLRLRPGEEMKVRVLPKTLTLIISKHKK